MIVQAKFASWSSPYTEIIFRFAQASGKEHRSRDLNDARIIPACRKICAFLLDECSFPAAVNDILIASTLPTNSVSTFRALPDRFLAEPTATPVGFSSGTNRIDISCGPALWLWVIEKVV
ncbi:MAG: hypothetical protein FJ143_04345 [Deltaproteobacteria bacterium]|nr:hypothetical protein [Deltaproteobacteria bacterium]